MRQHSGWRTSQKLWLSASLGAAFVFAAGLCAAQAPGRSPADARALLLRMASFLGQSQQLSVTVHAAYDTVQASGDKVEWNEVRKLTLRRPDRLRLEAEKSNGARSLVVFDGKEISAFDEAGRAYARATQPGGIDQTLVYFVRDLGMRLPLAALFMNSAARDFDRRIQSVEYVEKTGILGVPTHHLVGRTDSVNFQVWISDGDQPLPQRIVLTYRGAPGQPQYRAQFSGWNVAAEPDASLFTFTPPSDTTKIPFTAALPRAAGSPTGAAPKSAPAKKEAK
jgi:hypothetical protein